MRQRKWYNDARWPERGSNEPGAKLLAPWLLASRACHPTCLQRKVSMDLFPPSYTALTLG
eukprot:283396-Chlamydomonas_euryale.AAC.11